MHEPVREALAVARPAETAVLMAVYGGDRPESFRAALWSVLKQEYGDFELLLMVDGPVDPGIRREIDAVTDPRLRVFRTNQKRGLAAGLNDLINHALVGDYRFFARMDSDDVSYRDRFRRQIDFMVANPAVDVLGSACNEVDGAGNALVLKRLPATDGDLKRGILERCPFIHPTVVFRRRVFEQGARYRTDSYLTEDMFLWVDLAKRNCVFANVPEPLLEYRVGAEFYGRRSGFRKACSEYRAKRYIARELGLRGIRALSVACAAFGLRLLPPLLLKLCYRLLR